MSTRRGETAEAERPIWRFEALSAFEPPPASLSEATRSGLQGLIARFRNQTFLGLEEEEEKAALVRLDADELARSVPIPSFDLLGEALGEALAPWPDSAGTTPIRLVVHTHPGLGAEAVEALASSRGWHLLAPPTCESILADAGPAPVELLPDTDEPIVVTHLERWFLRTPHSLSATRDLLGRVALRPGPTLVSCGSWAYAWLCGALRADTVLPAPIALSALDPAALAAWLGSAADGSLVFRDEKGAVILPLDTEDEEGKRAQPAEFLRHLAAEARGNPAVAAALWARGLRRPSGDEPDAAANSRPASEWTVIPWSDVQRPTLGRIARPDEIAVLHAISLHATVTAEVLTRTLPFGAATISSALAAFSATGLIEEHGGAWQITAAGYPAVRRELLDAGHPADAF